MEHAVAGGALRVERREFVFRYESPAQVVDIFRRFCGPTHKAFAALDGAGQDALAADIAALAERHDRSRSAMAVPAEYLEVVIER